MGLQKALCLPDETRTLKGLSFIDINIVLIILDNQNVSPSLEESCYNFRPGESAALLVVIDRGLHHTLIIYVDLMHVRGLISGKIWRVTSSVLTGQL